MTGCYISNYIDIIGDVEELEKFKNEITPEVFCHWEDNENTKYIVNTLDDGNLAVTITVRDSHGYAMMEQLGKKYPNLEFLLHWTDIHGSIFGYVNVEKGEVVYEESLFSDYICCNCCEYNEDCECVFKPLVFTELSEAERPF